MATLEFLSPITDPQTLCYNLLQSFQAIPFFPDLINRIQRRSQSSPDGIDTTTVSTSTKEDKQTSTTPKYPSRGAKTLDILKSKEVVEDMEVVYQTPRTESFFSGRSEVERIQCIGERVSCSLVPKVNDQM